MPNISSYAVSLARLALKKGTKIGTGEEMAQILKNCRFVHLGVGDRVQFNQYCSRGGTFRCGVMRGTIESFAHLTVFIKVRSTTMNWGAPKIGEVVAANDPNDITIIPEP